MSSPNGVEFAIESFHFILKSVPEAFPAFELKPFLENILSKNYNSLIQPIKNRIQKLQSIHAGTGARFPLPVARRVKSADFRRTVAHAAARRARLRLVFQKEYTKQKETYDTGDYSLTTNYPLTNDFFEKLIHLALFDVCRERGVLSYHDLQNLMNPDPTRTPPGIYTDTPFRSRGNSIGATPPSGANTSVEYDDEDVGGGELFFARHLDFTK